MLNRILLVVNPRSGSTNRPLDLSTLKEGLKNDQWTLEYTKYPGHARDIASSRKSDFDLIVAVGGDGTINEVASAIVDSNVVLGILPRGSGNGLANFLGLPKELGGLINMIKNARTKKIDTANLDSHFFVNMSGVGFDSHIAHLFKDFGSRGFLTYSRLVLREFGKYVGLDIQIETEGRVRNESVYLLSFANSSQYGNNAYIAPKAVIDDGKIDVCIVRRPGFLTSIRLLWRLFAGNLANSSYYRTFSVSELRIRSQQELLAHIDGEPITLGKEAMLSVRPKSLNVLVP